MQDSPPTIPSPPIAGVANSPGRPSPPIAGVANSPGRPSPPIAGVANFPGRSSPPNVASPVDQRSFPERLRSVLHDPYTVSMRRSIQTCVLLEANRCLELQYGRLKAFQRKVALHDTASDIVETLLFIPPHQRMEIMYRTATSKQFLSPDLTWRRMKLIDREITKTIIPKIMPLIQPGKRHDEVCKAYLQQEYETMTGKKDPYYPNWEFSHDNNFAAYKMFYDGAVRNPMLPPAVDPNPQRVVPSVRPRPEVVAANDARRAAKVADIANKISLEVKAAASRMRKRQRIAAEPLEMPFFPNHELLPDSNALDDATERRALLKEIKDHIEILHEFKGIISEDDLNERKRALFERLPKP